MASGQKTAEVYVASDNEPMVATVDWRTKGVVTGVKNQVCELTSQQAMAVSYVCLLGTMWQLLGL